MSAQTTAIEGAQIEPRALRNVLGTFPTGVTVVTTLDAQNRPCGLTVNSFSSVSLNPPLILWNQALNSPSYPVFRDVQRFAINILAEDQIGISKRFATSGIDKFDGVQTSTGLGGVPLIQGCAAHLECVREASFPGGDHSVFIGRVERMASGARKPLVFGGGRYMMARPHEMELPAADRGAASSAHLQAVRLAGEIVTDLSRRMRKMVALAVWGNHGPTVIGWEQRGEGINANLRTGMVCQVTSTATGRAFAAWLPSHETDWVVMNELAAEGLSPAEIAQRREAFDALLRPIRERGYASVRSSPNEAGTSGRYIDAVSCPIFDPNQDVAACITVVNPCADPTGQWERAAATALTEAARGVTRRFSLVSSA